MTTEEKTKKIEKVGFRRGLAQIRIGDFAEARNELYKALGIENRTSFAKYASGKTEMKVSQAEAVERVFNSYGITKDIWGV